MKLFNFQSFIEADYTFGDNALGFTVEKAQSEDNSRAFNYIIKKDNVFLFSAVYYNKWHYGLNTRDVIAIDTAGLSSKTLDGMMDDIYYKINPIPSLKNNRGRIFRGHYNELYKRLRSSETYNCHVTKYLIEEISKEVKEDAIRLSNQPVGSVAFNTWMFSHLPSKLQQRLKVCAITGVFANTSRLRRSNVSGAQVWVHGEVDFSTHGYTRTDNIWHLSTEVVYNRQVYLIADGFTTCPNCDRDHVPTHDIDENTGHCSVCSSSAYEVHSYSTRVPNILKFKAKKVTPNTLYLGCELEYETSDYNAARMKVGRALNGHAIMKSDGSISHGFEIVTCPATIDIQLDVFKKFFSNRPEELEAKPNTGMHVHVSRSPLSVLTVGKLTEFMNKRDNQKFIEYLAGRKLNHYCNMANRSVTFPLTVGRGDRYNSLNLQNEATIEFRIFSSPLTYEDFASKVQFCQALVDFAKPAQSGAALKTQTNYNTFMTWVLPRRKDYPELVSKLKGFN